MWNFLTPANCAPPLVSCWDSLPSKHQRRTNQYAFLLLPCDVRQHAPRGGTYCIWSDKVGGIYLFLLISTGIKYNLLPWECNGLCKRQSKATLNFIDYVDSKTVITSCNSLTREGSMELFHLLIIPGSLQGCTSWNEWKWAVASGAHCWQKTEKWHFQATNHAWISASLR